MNRPTVSVGRALPGMQDVGRNASSNIKASSTLVKLLQEAAENVGCVKVEIEGERLVGKKLFHLRTSADRDWSEKLDDLAQKVDDVNPCLFVLFRGNDDCMLVKYIPDGAKTRVKMLYASSVSSVKDTIRDLGADIEEYNVSSPDELSYEEYSKMKAVAAPLTEAEIARKEQDEAETSGGYSLLARISVRSPVALPGLSRDGQVPDFIAKQRGSSMEEVNMDNDDDEDEEDDDDAYVSNEDAEEEASSRRSSRRSSKSRKSSSRKSSSRVSKIEQVEEEVSSDDEDDPEQYPYTVDDVRKMKELGEFDDNMDPSSLELYITSKSFKTTFGMRKSAFAELPSWKRIMLKKKHGIF